MPQVYSVRFYAGRPGQSVITLFTVPPGVVWIVRDVLVVALAVGSTGQIIMSGASGSPAVPIFAAASIGANQAIHQECRIVLNAGEKIQLNPAGADTLVQVSGYQLAL